MTAEDFKQPQNRQLAEVGIGYNANAALSECFMEAEMKQGTCHFCFGSNTFYGGANTSEFHGGSVLICDPVFIRL